MALTATISSEKLQDELSMATVPGLLGLGMATALQTLAASPLLPHAQILIPTIFLCAALQIVAGLNAWRRGQSFLSITFIAFGLFSCSQLPQLAALGGDSRSLLAEGSLLLFWGLFALFLTLSAEAFGRPFQLTLAAVTASMLIKALLLATGCTFAWQLPLGAGVVAVVAAGVAIQRILAQTVRS